MKELNVYDTLIQNEALINELKGNLFEFLVGRELAASHGVEGQFLGDLPEDFKERLQGYENWLRENSHKLLERLPALAKDTAMFINKEIQEDLDGVLVVGKIAGGNQDRRLAEADLLIKNDELIRPLSLKLCKAGSFVNTKSAGIRSFFSKYFGAAFPVAMSRQKQLNEKLESDYTGLSLKLHKMAGLEPEPRFGKAWSDSGQPVLPGQLNLQMNDLLKQHYFFMIQEFFTLWSELLHEDPLRFHKCMMPLLGFGDENLSQVSCFYKGEYETSFNSLAKIDYYKEQLKTAELISPKEGLSSFDLQMRDCTFQVRLKPMNKFIVPGLKVNCSIKLKSCDRII